MKKLSDRAKQKYQYEELRRLVIYAADIYHQTTMTKPFSEWEPCDDVVGLLCQLSNTLRGISDSVIDTQAAMGALAEITSKGWMSSDKGNADGSHTFTFEQGEK